MQMTWSRMGVIGGVAVFVDETKQYCVYLDDSHVSQKCEGK